MAIPKVSSFFFEKLLEQQMAKYFLSNMQKVPPRTT